MWKLRAAAAGDLQNDQVICYKICMSNGFPHEPITFQKVNGRVLSDGSNEVKVWTVLDYFTNSIHEHWQKEEMT